MLPAIVFSNVVTLAGLGQATRLPMTPFLKRDEVWVDVLHRPVLGIAIRF